MGNNYKISIASVLALTLGSATAVADPVETYIGLNAAAPSAVVSALDTLFASDAGKGSKVYLVRSVFDGEDPVTHFLVSEYDNFADYDKMTASRVRSSGWGDAMAAVNRHAEPIRSGIGIIRADYGSGWPDRDNFIMVFSLKVADANKYAEALDELANSDIGKQAPGITRLLENRSAGAAPSHYVVMSAPTFAALNEHLDAMFASEAYADFNDEVSDIRDIVGTSSYRKVKVWETD
jgi:hypothetical protein